VTLNDKDTKKPQKRARYIVETVHSAGFGDTPSNGVVSSALWTSCDGFSGGVVFNLVIAASATLCGGNLISWCNMFRVAC
jgi:hypothetical protein